mgnify:CR=1 FL=1
MDGCLGGGGLAHGLIVPIPLHFLQTVLGARLGHALVHGPGLLAQVFPRIVEEPDPPAGIQGSIGFTVSDKLVSQGDFRQVSIVETNHQG